MTAPNDATLERLGDDPAPPESIFQLTLFVSGASDLAGRAIANARQICELCLEGRYQLSVVDVHDDPEAVRRSQILATPTLVKHSPLPQRKVVGDLSRTERVIFSLGLPVAAAAPRAAS